jgi:hypothetical protein
MKCIQNFGGKSFGKQFHRSLKKRDPNIIITRAVEKEAVIMDAKHY